MTEDEAKTKWCPHAVASHTDPRTQTGYARPELGLQADVFLHACIGAACMAWRWEAASSRAAMWVRGAAPTPKGEEKLGGFCGLAGRPE